MPLAPPVTTTILPFTCIAEPRGWRLRLRQNEVEHGRVMARRAEQHERVPDHILEAQPLPCVEDYPETVEQATGENEPQCHTRQRGKAGVVGDQAAPAHGQGKPPRTMGQPARETTVPPRCRPPPHPRRPPAATSRRRDPATARRSAYR